MGVILDAPAAVAGIANPGSDDDTGNKRPPSLAGSRAADKDDGLDGQARPWAANTQLPELPVPILVLGLTCRTRLHGIISLEIGHHLASAGVNPTLLYGAEGRTLIHRASQPHGPDQAAGAQPSLSPSHPG